MPRITTKGPTGPPVAYRFEKDTIRIGRSPDNDLSINDPRMSRSHAEIVRDGDAWFVIDLGSHNGVLLNRKPVDRRVEVAPGDEITMGWTVFVFSDTNAPEDCPGDNGPRDLQTWSAGNANAQVDSTSLVGQTPAIQEILVTIDKIAPSEATVLIVGETGTGKELVARLIHRRSLRAHHPFVVINCPAIMGSLLEAELFGVEKGVATGVDARPGRFESAHGGTLFLDEIGDLAPGAQATILRFLEEKCIEKVGGRTPIPLDVRIVAATNHVLAEDIRRGTFRGDLYHRLNTVMMTLPPLRDRREDIPILIQHFLGCPKGRPLVMSPDALEILVGYDYPGNVRELRQLVERCRLLAAGHTVCSEDLPVAVRSPAFVRPACGATDPKAISALLYERVVKNRESFWSVVKDGYLQREVPRSAVAQFLERAYQESGCSYRKLASLLKVEHEYKRLLNFLTNHGFKVNHKKAGPPDA